MGMYVAVEAMWFAQFMHPLPHHSNMESNPPPDMETESEQAGSVQVLTATLAMKDLMILVLMDIKCYLFQLVTISGPTEYFILQLIKQQCT